MKISMLVGPPVLFAALFAGATAAQDGDGGIACNPEGTQVELNACAAEDYAEADAALNATWKQLVAALADDALARRRLREAQRAWLAFRDAEVAARLPVDDGADPRLAHGSMYPLLANSALAEITRYRTAELRARLQDLQAR
jgi:uncharacterized protein YecT (DUF1311 family)